MPWLNMHLAVPACVLAAWTVQRAWTAFAGGHDGRGTRRAALPLASAAVVGAGGVHRDQVATVHRGQDEPVRLVQVLVAGRQQFGIPGAAPHFTGQADVHVDCR